ncbi:MAG: cyclic nucleotide-binding domain-containing protein [Marinisporobacter sp.]|jgi:CRP-like cAMP-binding protein|nr:cyclic nucleotide-binding domain-containing protein [Marinisporobacter sp.]
MRLGVRDIEKLKNIGNLRIYHKDSYIFRQNDWSTEMYIIVSGVVQLTVGEEDKLIQLAILKQGEILGEMALLEDMPRCATAQAKTDCTVFVIPKNNFEKLIQVLPKMGIRISRKLSSRLRQANEELWFIKNSE